jgi:hypothetical protein
MTRRTVILGVAGAAAVAALLIALLSNGGHSRVFSSARDGAGGPTLVRIAASYLGIAPSELRRRLRSGETLAQVIASNNGASQAGLIKAAYAANARAVKRRHLSPAVERTELMLLRSRLTARIERPAPHLRIQAAAGRYLGLDEVQLQTRLAGGRTLGTLAAATPGHSRAGLIEALLAARLEALRRAARAGQITEQAERRAATAAHARTVRLVDRPGG